ncbi:MAG: trypsin-like peptidase domain-containing protein [Flavobacteriales bacterium]|nr:trypsin-like peptidase domain-containing protein [Flavobacteriales bacterium]
MTMKQAFGYFAMGLAGALIALGGHQLLSKGELATANSKVATPVQFVNLPNGSGGTTSTLDFTYAAEHTVNAVVHVTTETAVNIQDPFAQFFWGYRARQQQQLRQGGGSGVIVSGDGYIMTNNHVVEGADKIMVHLNDNRAYEGKVIGRDPSTDLALLKIDAEDLAIVPYGNSDAVRVGEWVLAVGNPMNLTSTVTAGIVSAKARNINLLQYDASRDVFPIESFIQTDAAVNPGNSGGALVNAQGELVGINTAIASNNGQYAGYSFAVPVNIVQKVAADLLEFGSVQRAYIGVSIRDMDQKLAEETKVGRIRGVYVNGITDGGSAQNAGMMAGDVIVKVGNIEVNNVTQLQEQVGKFRPGNKVPITAVRKGIEQVFNMTLRGKEGTTVARVEPRISTSGMLGAEFELPSAQELKALNLTNGVKVTSVNGGKFRSTGIREGFIIISIDQVPVKDPAQLEQMLAKKRGGVLVEGVYANGKRAYYGLGL